MKKDARAVLDASAILAILQEEPGWESLRSVLASAVVCSVNAAEVLAKLVRDGVPLQEALAALSALHLETIAFDAADAERSAVYIARGVSLGDRCFLAAAARYGEGFTADRQLSERIPNAPRLRSFR